MPASRTFRIATERLTIRPMERGDITEFTRYRNLPDVARYQEWPLPYTRDHAHVLVDASASAGGPTPAEWVQLALADHSDRLVGDLAVWMDDSRQLAMVGYTIAPEYQRRGYAGEGVAALVDWLFATGVHRIAATIDPANLASARVLERNGFRYLGTARSAAFVRGEWADDARFELLVDDWRGWTQRSPVDAVELVPITADNVRVVNDLDRAFSQRRFVSSVAQSYGDALVTHLHDGVPIVPWYRAIYADGQPVGFILVAEPAANAPHPYLWRILVDWRHQRRGVGVLAMRALATEWARRGATHLELSCVADVPGSPEGFYRAIGFERTGVVDGDETEFRAAIDRLLRSPGELG